MYQYNPYPESLQRAVCIVNDFRPKFVITRAGPAWNERGCSIRDWSHHQGFVPRSFRDPVSAIARWIDSTPINADGIVVTVTPEGWELRCIERSLPLHDPWEVPTWRTDRNASRNANI